MTHLLCGECRLPLSVAKKDSAGKLSALDPCGHIIHSRCYELVAAAATPTRPAKCKRCLSQTVGMVTMHVHLMNGCSAGIGRAQERFHLSDGLMAELYAKEHEFARCVAENKEAAEWQRVCAEARYDRDRLVEQLRRAAADHHGGGSNRMIAEDPLAAAKELDRAVQRVTEGQQQQYLSSDIQFQATERELAQAIEDAVGRERRENKARKKAFEQRGSARAAQKELKRRLVQLSEELRRLAQSSADDRAVSVGAVGGADDDDDDGDDGDDGVAEGGDVINPYRGDVSRMRFLQQASHRVDEDDTSANVLMVVSGVTSGDPDVPSTNVIDVDIEARVSPKRRKQSPSRRDRHDDDVVIVLDDDVDENQKGGIDDAGDVFVYHPRKSSQGSQLQRTATTTSSVPANVLPPRRGGGAKLFKERDLPPKQLFQPDLSI